MLTLAVIAFRKARNFSEFLYVCTKIIASTHFAAMTLNVMPTQTVPRLDVTQLGFADKINGG